MPLQKWFFFVSLLFMVGCQSPEKPSDQSTLPVNKSYRVKTVRHQNGWGFEIKQGEKTIIRQLHIPSIAGKRVFQTEKDAQKTGQLMIEKMEKKHFPPSVNKVELDSLHVAYSLE